MKNTNLIDKIDSLNLNENNSKKLNPYYIAGLIHANGGFLISKTRRGKNIWLTAKFHLTLEKKHEAIIKAVKEYFNAGNYRIDNKGYCRYEVGKQSELINIIIPFFLKYQIMGEKFKSFIMFKIICEKMYNKEHYLRNNPDNKVIYYLLNAGYNMNNLSNVKMETKLKLLEYVSEENRQIVLSDKIYYQDLINKEIKKYENFKLNIDFIKGLFDGDGNIIIWLDKSTMSINISFSIIQYKDNLDLLQLIQKYFNNIGQIYLNEDKNNNTYRYDIKNKLDIMQKLIPKFDNFENGINTNVRLYKLPLLADLLEWINTNNIINVKDKENFLIYLEFYHLIFFNKNYLNFEEYKIEQLKKYNFM